MVCCVFEGCIQSYSSAESTTSYSHIDFYRNLVSLLYAKGLKNNLIVWSELWNGFMLGCKMCVINTLVTSSLGHKRKKEGMSDQEDSQEYCKLP